VGGGVEHVPLARNGRSGEAEVRVHLRAVGDSATPQFAFTSSGSNAPRHERLPVGVAGEVHDDEAALGAGPSVT
jgi:hypothetical protein